jgi:hypothetical protein
VRTGRLVAVGGALVAAFLGWFALGHARTLTALPLWWAGIPLGAFVGEVARRLGGHGRLVGVVCAVFTVVGGSFDHMSPFEAGPVESRAASPVASSGADRASSALENAARALEMAERARAAADRARAAADRARQEADRRTPSSAEPSHGTARSRYGERRAASTCVLIGAILAFAFVQAGRPR